MIELVLTNLVLAGYFTHQQRQVMALRKQQHHDRLLAIVEVSRTVGTQMNPDAIFDCITKTCYKTYPCDHVSLMLFDGETQSLEVRSVAGQTDRTSILGSRQRLGHGIAGRAAETGEALVLGPNFKRFKNMQSKHHGISAAMVVPITLLDELIGVLCVSSKRRICYDKEDLETLKVFAEIAGICCRHAEQSQQIQQTIRKLNATLEEASGPGQNAA